MPYYKNLEGRRYRQSYSERNISNDHRASLIGYPIQYSNSSCYSSGIRRFSMDLNPTYYHTAFIPPLMNLPRHMRSPYLTSTPWQSNNNYSNMPMPSNYFNYHVPANSIRPYLDDYTEDEKMEEVYPDEYSDSIVLPGIGDVDNFLEDARKASQDDINVNRIIPNITRGSPNIVVTITDNSDKRHVDLMSEIPNIRKSETYNNIIITPIDDASCSSNPETTKEQRSMRTNDQNKKIHEEELAKKIDSLRNIDIENSIKLKAVRSNIDVDQLRLSAISSLITAKSEQYKKIEEEMDQCSQKIATTEKIRSTYANEKVKLNALHEFTSKTLNSDEAKQEKLKDLTDEITNQIEKLRRLYEANSIETTVSKKRPSSQFQKHETCKKMKLQTSLQTFSLPPILLHNQVMVQIAVDNEKPAFQTTIVPNESLPSPQLQVVPICGPSEEKQASEVNEANIQNEEEAPNVQCQTLFELDANKGQSEFQTAKTTLPYILPIFDLSKEYQTHQIIGENYKNEVDAPIFRTTALSPMTAANDISILHTIPSSSIPSIVSNRKLYRKKKRGKRRSKKKIQNKEEDTSFQSTSLPVDTSNTVHDAPLRAQPQFNINKKDVQVTRIEHGGISKNVKKRKKVRTKRGKNRHDIQNKEEATSFQSTSLPVDTSNNVHDVPLSYLFPYQAQPQFNINKKDVQVTRIEHGGISKIEKVETPILKVRTVSSPKVYTIYETPLILLSSYRIHPDYMAMDNQIVSSTRFAHSVNPRKNVCHSELLLGKCKYENCKCQHSKEYVLDAIGILSNILSYCPRLCGVFTTDKTQMTKEINRFAETFLKEIPDADVEELFEQFSRLVHQNLNTTPPLYALLMPKNFVE